MSWTIEYDPRAIKDLRKLDRSIRHEVFTYMRDRVATAQDPRLFGKALRHDKFGLWRYRVRDFRMVCELRESDRTVHVIGVGHRKEIYD